MANQERDMERKHAFRSNEVQFRAIYSNYQTPREGKKKE